MYHANSLPCKNGWIARGVLNIKRSAKDEICLYIVIFWYKSEYQLEKNLIKHVVFSALSKNVSPPFQWQSPGAVRGGPREKVTQVLLRRKVMLCYDTNRFLNSCMFFEIFRSQNSNFKEKNGKKYCISRPELPPLVLNAGLHQKPNKCHSK